MSVSVYRPAVTQGFHFDDKHLKCLDNYPLNQVNQLEPFRNQSRSNTNVVDKDTDSASEMALNNERPQLVFFYHFCSSLCTVLGGLPICTLNKHLLFVPLDEAACHWAWSWSRQVDHFDFSYEWLIQFH